MTRPGRHLRDDVQVPAILGTADGTTTLSLVSDVAQPGGILVMSPRASTTTLRALSTSGLVWRTCPSDAIEGAALVAVTNGVVLPAVAGQSQPARVAVLHAADVTSTELEADVVAGLVLNGKPATDPSNAGNLIRADYGAPDDPGDADVDAAYRAAVAAVTSPAALPDVILLLGSTQAATRVLPMIEAAWPASRKPQYVVSSGVQTKELLAFTSGKAELRRRIVGTAPGANDATRDAFLARYRASITDSDAPEIFGAAQMYDAVYTLAYAAAAAAKTSLHGNDLSMALRRTLAPREGGAAVPITIGPDGIETAFAAITAGSWLALDGASAPLAFQTTTGEVVTDVQVWCIGAGSASPVFQDSGLSYLAGTSSLAGSLSCP